MKRAVLILSIIAIVGIIAGVVFAVSGAAAALGPCQQYANDQTQLQTCLQQNAGATTGGGGLILLGVLAYIVGGICALVAWILGLVKTAQIGRWGWFVLVLLISPLGSLIYGIAGPNERAVPAMATAQSPYQPPYQQ